MPVRTLPTRPGERWNKSIVQRSPDLYSCNYRIIVSYTNSFEKKNVCLYFLYLRNSTIPPIENNTMAPFHKATKMPSHIQILVNYDLALANKSWNISAISEPGGLEVFYSTTFIKNSVPRLEDTLLVLKFFRFNYLMLWSKLARVQETGLQFLLLGIIYY